MSRKANRIWAQRAEAIMLLATNPKATAVELTAALFNGDTDSIVSEVSGARKTIAARLVREHEAQSEIIAAAKAELEPAAAPTVKPASAVTQPQTSTQPPKSK